MSSESCRTLSTFKGRLFEDALIAYDDLYSSDEETEPASPERFADVGKETIESMKVTAEKNRISFIGVLRLCDCDVRLYVIFLVAN